MRILRTTRFNGSNAVTHTEHSLQEYQNLYNCYCNGKGWEILTMLTGTEISAFYKPGENGATIVFSLLPDTE